MCVSAHGHPPHWLGACVHAVQVHVATCASLPNFRFPFALGIAGRRADVCHAADADELFEVLGDELGPVVGDDPKMFVGTTFLGALQDRFHVGLGHRLPDFPMHGEAAVTVQHAAQVIERAGLATDPGDGGFSGDAGFGLPVADVIDDGVAGVVGNPTTV